MTKVTRIKGLGIAAVSLAFVPMLSSVAFADTNSSFSFSSRYQANASQEAQLLSEAQSSSYTNADTSALKTTVETLGTQITSLYASEQALANGESNLPNVQQGQWDANLNSLEQERKQLINEAVLAWQNVTWFTYGHGHHGRPQEEPRNWSLPQNFGQAKKYWGIINADLLNVDKQIESLKEQRNSWAQNSYGDALHTLQDSILKLQASAIQYTKEWIAIEQGNSSSTTSFGAPTGLTASNLSTTGWTVSWNQVTGATGYDVYLNGQIVTANVSGTSVSFSNKTPDTTYTVGIQAVNTTNNQQSALSDINVTTFAESPLAQPTINAITNVTSSGFTVGWTGVTGATGYNVYINGQKVLANYSGTSYAFTGEQAHTTYSVSVTAVNSSGQESTGTQAVQVTTLY